MEDSRQQTADSRQPEGSEAPRLRRRICNWCAQIVDETETWKRLVASNPNLGWTRATLRIDGLHDGSVSWLPEKVLDFCDGAECQSQLRRSEGFLIETPHVGLGDGQLRVWLREQDAGEITRFDESRYWGHEDAAQDARAFAHFFTATSHPKLRRVIEAFEPGFPEPSGATGRGP